MPNMFDAQDINSTITAAWIRNACKAYIRKKDSIAKQLLNIKIKHPKQEMRIQKERPETKRNKENV